MPTGKDAAARPTTKMEIGRVASDRTGASCAPTMAPVANITVVLAPASAVASARMKALRLASRSPLERALEVVLVMAARSQGPEKGFSVRAPAGESSVSRSGRRENGRLH
jgi:hypothetical protein